MALMVPDSIPSKASEGEKTLYNILRDKLPDDFYVWYEPKVKGYYPDFIILGPGLGLLIIEVKGWYAGNIVSGNNDFFEIEYQNGDGSKRIESQQSPLSQGKAYFGKVLDQLKQYSILTESDGNFKGKLFFPLGYGAVMSNINVELARKTNIYPLLEKPQVAYREELRQWKDMSQQQLVARLKQMFVKVWFPFANLTNDQISTIKGALYPQIVHKIKPASYSSVPAGIKLQPDSYVLTTLDYAQECLARKVLDGHCQFNGVAGSGKTLILLSRAKYLADQEPSQRILVLCYNITLAAYLRSLLREDEKNPQYQERILIMHFNAWARLILRRLPNPHDVVGDYDEFLGERLKEALANVPLQQKWDSILVDEAHTFSPNWFECCVAALKDSDSGDLMIVSDGSQKLYNRSKFTWKSVGVKVAGGGSNSRSKWLTTNYRNTQEILSAAWSILPSISTSTGQDYSDVTFPVVEPSLALRNGSRPVLHLEQSRCKETQATIQLLHHLVKRGYQSNDIAIVYHHKGDNDEPLFDDLVQQLDNSDLGAYWVTQNNAEKYRYSNQIPGVRIITALSSLGLEFKVVIILWVQQFAVAQSSDSEIVARERRQLYVAMTRAQEELYVFGSGNAPILNELTQSQHFDLEVIAYK
jgi:superfamily I DNA and RNA helicase